MAPFLWKPVVWSYLSALIYQRIITNHISFLWYLYFVQLLQNHFDLGTFRPYSWDIRHEMHRVLSNFVFKNILVEQAGRTNSVRD